MNSLTVAPITRTVRNIETEVALQPADGVPTPCAITLDNIFTIQRSALGETITVLPRDKLLLVFAAIHKAFDMS
jgi:mRNA-degrading endonuclease toxin of MazEF toxin-antitoxin module